MITVPVTETMPSAGVQTFTDPCEYQTFTCDAQHRVVLTARGPYQAKIIRLDLHRIITRRAWQSLPTVSHLAIPAGRSAICFPLNADRSSTIWRGREVHSGEMFVVHSGGDFHSRTDKEAHWASVSMASDALSKYMQAVAGSDLGLADVTHVRPRPAAMARLLAVHQAAGDLVETAPDVVLRPEVARVFEGNLMDAVVNCLTDAAMLQIDRSSRRPVMRRFEDLVEADPERILHLVEVCSAIGVSERTLRHCCMEHFRRESISVLAVAANASGSAGACAGGFKNGHCYRNRHAVWFLGTGAFFGGIQEGVRRITFDYDQARDRQEHLCTNQIWLT
jgi:hypothetical protein